MQKTIYFSQSAGFALLFAFSLLLSSCTYGVAPSTSTSYPIATSPEVSVSKKSAWQDSWQNTLQEARKEGKVVIHLGSGITPEVRQEFTRVIKSKYGLELEMIAGRNAELAERLFRERRAGLYLADLVIGGANVLVVQLKTRGVLEAMEPWLILPEVVDPKLWFEGRLPFIDEDKSILAFSAYVTGGLGINTDAVKKDDLLSYRDLLQPRWKGKIAMSDPTIGGAGSQWFSAMGMRVLGIDYLREFAKQDVVFSRDLRLLVEWLARGKYPILIGGGGTVDEVKKAGAPVNTILLKEGVYLTLGWGAITVYKDAPHPNATKVFINWLLSKEGQTIYSKGMDNQSARIDLPTDFLTDEYVRKSSVPYFNAIKEDNYIKQGEEQLLAKDIFSIK